VNPLRAVVPFQSGAVPGSLIPTADCSFDLGSAAFRWRNIYWCTQALAPDGAIATPSYSFANSPTRGIYQNLANGQLILNAGAQNSAALDTNGIRFISSYQLQWSSGDPTAQAADLIVVRDAANTIAQKNGANAQAHRIYNTTVGPEYASLAWASNRFQIDCQANGAHSLDLGGNTISLYPGGVVSNTGRWNITGAMLGPNSNGGADIGAGSTGIKRLYVDFTNTGTVGNVTINKSAGRVNLGAGGTTLTLTNSNITAASKIFLNPDSAPGNVVAVLFFGVCSAGSATINAVPAVTNQTAIDFLVVNTD